MVYCFHGLLGGFLFLDITFWESGTYPVLSLFVSPCGCCCSSCTGEGQGEHYAPSQLLLLRQQLLHQPQGECSVRLRRRLRLQLRIGARGAAQQKEAARGGQLDSGRPPPTRNSILHQPPLLLPVHTLSSLLIPVQETRWRPCERGAIVYKNASVLASILSLLFLVAQQPTLKTPKVRQLCSFEGFNAFKNLIITYS